MASKGGSFEIGSSRLPSRKLIRSARERSVAFSVASSRASGLRSVAVMCALVRFFASARAMQPEPVQISAMRSSSLKKLPRLYHPAYIMTICCVA